MSCVNCYNKGCGKTFDPEKNSEDSCRYHPGGPVFHDALKGWSCCKKRSTDFSEFLSIPGCTAGCHSNVKPAEPEMKPPVKEVDENLIQLPPQVIKPAEEVVRPSAAEAMTRLQATVGASLKQALAKQLQDMSLNDQAANDGTQGTEVKVGESCKNNACHQTYKDEESNFEACHHHPGCPIFHEGMKYWSCCQRKTSDFDNFMAQEGCTTGHHLWVKKDTGEKKVACRYDWHQTATFVTISVFAKVAIPEKTWVEVNRVTANINITFDKGGSVFKENIILNGVIDPSKSSVKMLGTKVEINLRKGEPGSWSNLVLQSNVTANAQDTEDDQAS